MNSNFIVVLLGPSASGKSYLVNKILPELDSDFQVVTKYISRDARPDEINEDGTLKNNDIIPGTSPEYIQGLDYHYATQRGDKTFHYGFPKSRIDELLNQGKIPVINKCNKETYIQLCRDYPNRMLTIFVDPATILDQVSAIDAMKHQGRSAAEIAQRTQEDPQADLWFENITPNHVGVINPASIRYHDIAKKPLPYFVALQLINIFKSIYDSMGNKEKHVHFIKLCDSYLSKLHEDEECYKLNRLLNVKSQEMPVNMKKRNEYGTASPNQIYWWTWAEQQFFKQHHANYFFEPETWNSYAEMNDLPTVEVPKQPPLDYDVIDSFKDDHESH